jgi:antitoxin ParD1/3/4
MVTNVSLTPELEQLVRQKVESGRYLSISEVVREGLRLLEERDRLYQARLSELQTAVNIGIEQSDRGEVLDGETVIQELRFKNNSMKSTKPNELYDPAIYPQHPGYAVFSEPDEI